MSDESGLIGTNAPEITLKNQDGKDVKLSSFNGKNILLVFYCMNNTPG
ncbi:MAG: redoxin domain-containing protein [Planctomycetes bacterium]|nr:redoxin domain-containing protein [Planctomycetota bacterium]